MTRPVAWRFEPAYAPSTGAPVSCRGGAVGAFRTADPGGHRPRLALRGRRDLLHHDERACLGQSDARGTFRSIGAMLSGGEPRFTSLAERLPRWARSLEGSGDCAAIDGTFALSRTGAMIVPTEVSCPRRMMVILQLRTVARAQLPRKRVRPRDRHAVRAIARIGAVTAGSCQLSPRSGLRSSRPSAIPQTSSPARAASAYGIDSPGTGSSRQASPSQR
jgi:hypothetical protein